jgi:hypothetical protein
MQTAYRYEIRVERHLGTAVAAHFPGFTLTHRADGDTSLCGVVPDQAALHGALTRVRDLGLTLVAVRRLSPAAPGER